MTFAPIFQADQYKEEEVKSLSPFFTNLDKSVYAPLILSPELIGALCSRTSRAAYDLRPIYLKEFIEPFLNPVREEKDTEETWQEKIKHGEVLKKFIDFASEHPITELFANPRARSFYTKWLAQFGDDSIAQMAGLHLVFCGLSQIAIKHFENQRLGLAPIEKSTRYVNYSQKINGQYLYYVDPTLSELGLETEYRQAMDNLFGTYANLMPRLAQWLAQKFSNEKPAVIEKKAFDTLRGLLPTATLSQVAFFGNGQAFEYLVSRSLKHPLGEIRWAGQRAYEELNQVTPSFFRRLEKEEAKNYQEYLGQKGKRVASLVNSVLGGLSVEVNTGPTVRLIEYDPMGEDKILAGIIFDAPGNQFSWPQILEKVWRLSREEKLYIFQQYLRGRTARWQKIGRAFENTYVRFEIVMNIGAWRDIQRHRAMTQQNQLFSCAHSYDVPSEIIEAGMETEFRAAIKQAEEVHQKIAAHDVYLAQYAVTLAHRLRFMQWQNLRECFWEIELRTIPEGHSDYRKIEQEKFALLKKIYPLICEHMMVNLGDYDFARRGQDDKIQKKIQSLG